MINFVFYLRCSVWKIGLMVIASSYEDVIKRIACSHARTALFEHQDPEEATLNVVIAEYMDTIQEQEVGSTQDRIIYRRQAPESDNNK